MAIGWYICPMVRRIGVARPERYCSMDDFTDQIVAEGGTWSESEILGNVALVKVRASAITLASLAGTFQRIPLSRLDDPLGSLTAIQRQSLKTFVLNLGYTVQEVQDALGTDLSGVTLGQLLRFMASRRLTPRYDSGTDTIVCDGDAVGCRGIDHLDSSVT